jgi:hypothetical protein
MTRIFRRHNRNFEKSQQQNQNIAQFSLDQIETKRHKSTLILNTKQITLQ